MGKIWNDRDFVNHSDIFTPFVAEKVRKINGMPVISFGLGSFGYDLQLADEFKMFCPALTETDIFFNEDPRLDPKNVDPKDWSEFKGEHIIIPAGHFVLGRSTEYIKMPDNCVGLCLGKSTYARVGLSVNITPLEPGWQGYLAIEIHNNSAYPAVVYAGEGIAQVLVFEGEAPRNGYGQDGKYQNQQGIQLPKV